MAFMEGTVMEFLGFLPIVVVLIAMYFFMIRPQKKQEQEQNNMRNNLAVGDEITTIGGIIGKIVARHRIRASKRFANPFLVFSIGFFPPEKK
jgi:preprotein translocase YajC subunit